MNKITVKFMVRESAGKPQHEVELEIDFEGATNEIIRKHAVANYVVQLQGQFRTHWIDFKAGKYPKTIKFGEPMFAKRVRTIQAPVTEESAVKFINGHEKESARLGAIINIMKSAGMVVTDDILEAYHRALESEKE